MKRMMGLAVCVCLLAACKSNGGGGGGGGNGGGNGGGSATLKSNIGLDVAHIVGFAVGSGGPAASRRLGTSGAWSDDADGGTSISTAHLYAIDDQGNLTVTTVLTTDNGDGGTSMTTSMNDVPSAIYDTPLYVLFTYDNLYVSDATSMSQKSCHVLMRKSDGALFCLTNGAGMPPIRIDQVTANASGDTIVLGARQTLVRVDVSGAAPQMTSLLDSSGTQGLSAMTANAAGDILLGFDSTNPMAPSSGERVIKKNGGLQNVSATEALCQWRVSAASNDFYYLLQSFPNQQNTQNVVQQTRQGDGSYVAANLTTTTAGVSGGCRVALASPTYAWGTLNMSGSSSALVDMFDPGTAHPIAGVATIANLAASGSSLFVQGNDSVGNGTIVRVDVPSLTPTTILPAGDFSLTAISLSQAGDLSFAGLRNSDGAQIIGNVPAGTTTFTIVSATAPTVTTLQRIN